MKHLLCLTALASACFLPAGRSETTNDEPMPQLGSSVRFPKDPPSFRMEDLRGKTTLLLFFQEW